MQTLTITVYRPEPPINIKKVSQLWHMSPTKPLFSTFYRILGVQRRLNLTKAIKPIFKSSKTLETSHNWEAYSRFACVKPGRVGGGGGLFLLWVPLLLKAVSTSHLKDIIQVFMIIGFQENIQRPLIRTKCQRWRNGWCSENSRVALDFFHLRPVDKIHFVTRYTETHLPSGDGNSCTNKNNFNRNGHEKRWS